MKVPMAWSVLGRLASVKLVSTMYVWLIVVPLAAKALESVPPDAIFMIFCLPVKVNLQLPFSWVLFYFGAVAFTVANLLFHFRCPKIVKDHKSAKDFRIEGKGWAQLLDYRDDAGYPEKDFKLLHGLIKDGKSLDEEDRKRLDPKGRFHYMVEPENRYHALFYVVYELAERQRKDWRLACNALYLLGFGLIGAVLFQNFMAVVRLSICHAS